MTCLSAKRAAVEIHSPVAILREESRYDVAESAGVIGPWIVSGSGDRDSVDYG